MIVDKSDKLPVRQSEDVVRVRQAVRISAVALGFSLVDQTKVVTAASEIARNTLDYGGGGELIIDQVRAGVRRGLRLVLATKVPALRICKRRSKTATRPATAWAWG